MFRKVASLFAALGLVASVSACDLSSFNAQLVQTTTNVVALNNALVQVNITIINNFIAQQKLLAPYTCGAYALASAIVQGSPAADTVNAYLTKQVAAGVTNVAVKSICSALGYPATVSAPASTPVVATAPAS